VVLDMENNSPFLLPFSPVSIMSDPSPPFLSGLVWGIGTILGPVIGGAFVESPATWRWAFYINLCVAGLFAPVYLFLLPSFKPRAGTPTSRLVRELDVVGSVLYAGAVLCLVMAINFGGTLYAWGGGQTIALFVVSGVCFVLLAVQQTLCILTMPDERIFPVQFLANVNAVLVFVSAAAINTATFVPIYYIPLYFQFTRGDNAIEAAMRLLPLIFAISISVLLNGHLMSRWSFFQPWYIFGSVLALVGGVLLCECCCPNILGKPPH
jgi:MFS family permease